MPERIECDYDRCLLVGDHPNFLEIEANRCQIFDGIADVLVFGAVRRSDRILPPITRSADVTTSLEANESTIGMITCEYIQGAELSWSSTD
jgi:hypothetical protein